VHQWFPDVCRQERFVYAEFCNSERRWTNRFVLWLKELKLETDYGRKTLDLLIAQCEDLRAQQLNMMKELERYLNISHHLLN
ncbi:MAG: hypothetical protein IKA13_05475, partial [Bacteroidales bacterium]|nr:hypothetical protein [Bacteroidales bacterium]